MTYSNYEDSIMQGWRCKIVGYLPQVPFISPSLITSLPKMCVLHDGWMDSSICWVWMTTVEVKEHAADLVKHCEGGEIVSKKRKMWVMKKKVLEEGSSDGGNKENMQPSKRTKRMRNVRGPRNTTKDAAGVAAQMPPRSVSVVIDTLDEEVEDGEG